MRLEVFHGGEDLGGGQHELLGDLVVGDHHHLHPSLQSSPHTIGSVLEHQTGGGGGGLTEPEVSLIYPIITHRGPDSFTPPPTTNPLNYILTRYLEAQTVKISGEGLAWDT